jgi:chromosome segregation ATPase
LIKKEYGYDDALLSLQNDINDLETKNGTLKREINNLTVSLAKTQSKLNDSIRKNYDLEGNNVELKAQLQQTIAKIETFNSTQHNITLIEQKHKENINKMNNIIEELMSQVEFKTKKEVESLKSLYNSNIKKLIEECSSLDSDRNTKASQIEKLQRAKRLVESDLKAIKNEQLIQTEKENNKLEDLHRRICLIEKSRDEVASKLIEKENENKHLKVQYENERRVCEETILKFTSFGHKSSNEVEKLSDENKKTLEQLELIKEQLKQTQLDNESIQKKLNKQIQLKENELNSLKLNNLNKIEIIEKTTSNRMSELRLLLDQQQRMSNK